MPSHKKPLQFDVLAVTEKLRGPSVLPMLMNCAWGCAWPGWKLKFNDAGLALSKGVLVTFKVTGYVTGLLAAPLAAR